MVIFQKTSKTTRLRFRRSTSACYSSDLENVKIINNYFHHCSCGTLKVRIKKRHFLANVEFSQPCCAAFADLPCWVTPVLVHQFGHLHCFEWSVHVVCHLCSLSIFWFQFHIPDSQQGIYLVCYILEEVYVTPQTIKFGALNPPNYKIGYLTPQTIKYHALNPLGRFC